MELLFSEGKKQLVPTLVINVVEWLGGNVYFHSVETYIAVHMVLGKLQSNVYFALAELVHTSRLIHTTAVRVRWLH